VLDGEIVAWRRREPYFPLVCRRVLTHDFSVPITFVIFDLLRLDGTDPTDRPHAERRGLLEMLALDSYWWTTPETFTEGAAIPRRSTNTASKASLQSGDSRYRPGERRWVKVKNPNYWRRDAEIESIQRSLERRTHRLVRSSLGD
jgi:bifunctional non-homologous end joining protein LigD